MLIVKRVDLPVRIVPEEPVDMALFQWRARLDPLLDIERQVDRLLASMQFPFPVVRFDRPFPPVNVYELDHEYLVVVEAPGVLAQSLDIFVQDGVLLLRGERPAVPGVSDERYRRHERHLGRWERNVPLPDRCDHDRIAAEFADGILRIHLPKLAETKPRQIRVSGNAPPENARHAIQTIHPTGQTIPQANHSTAPQTTTLPTTATHAATIHQVTSYPVAASQIAAKPTAGSGDAATPVRE